MLLSNPLTGYMMIEIGISSNRSLGVSSLSPVLTVITPAFNEAENLPIFYKRLKAVANDLGLLWEWLIIDDHSTDNTFDVIVALGEQDSRVKGIRFARNFGSHTAIACGLEHAHGECAVVMAADLQDPPESIPLVLKEWRKGFQIVWGARGKRKGEKARNLFFSRLFFFVMRRIVGIKNMPATGADFFLLDRLVIDALGKFDERNLSLAALLTWMGFNQTIVTYDKQIRMHGISGWNLSKKILIIIDSITSFSYLPIRLMSLMGIFIAFLGFLYAGLVIVRAVAGDPPDGWSSLMVVILLIGGFQMLMLGILGEYIWRSLDESRRRPRYWVENRTYTDKK